MSAVRLPDNPCPERTVAWVAWEVLSGRKPTTGEVGRFCAFVVPVSREAVELEVRDEFKALTGEYHTIDTVGRMIRGGTKGFMNWYARSIGWKLQTPDDAEGKRLDGRVKLVRLDDCIGNEPRRGLS